MNICFISDTHGQHNKLIVPDADVLVHTGDLTGHGYEYEAQVFMKWFSEVPGDYKARIFIAGNHDWCFLEKAALMKDQIPENVTYLFDSSITIDNLKFYGTPWQPVFCDWAFNLPEEKLQLSWDLIPEDTDILLTHCPPYNVLDKSNYGVLCGSKSLLEKVNKINPIVHAFGHIHEAYGSISLFDNITFVNGSVLNRRYELTNDPIVINAVK